MKIRKMVIVLAMGAVMLLALASCGESGIAVKSPTGDYVLQSSKTSDWPSSDSVGKSVPECTYGTYTVKYPSSYPVVTVTNISKEEVLSYIEEVKAAGFDLLVEEKYVSEVDLSLRGPNSMGIIGLAYNETTQRLTIKMQPDNYNQ